MNLELRQPCHELAASFVRLRDACLHIGEDEWRGRLVLAHTDVAAYIETLLRRNSGQEIAEDWVPWVPETTLWIVESNEVVGDVQLRHPLNEWLLQIGGNIGYGTHPGHRNQGIATFALREGLKLLAGMGVSEALATCRDDNVASIRVIENCGGVRIADSTAKGPKRLRYAIPTSSTAERCLST
ncbi:MAG: GNAT family N-acetyltransferase [Candidatus Tumulicola sp.]